MAITKTKASTEYHLRAVLTDPEFTQEFDKLQGHVDEAPRTQELFERYGISYDDIDFHQSRFALGMNPYTLFSAGWLEYDDEKNEFVARFKVDINKGNLEDLWKLIQKNQAKLNMTPTKNKAPADWQLLYAIFKGVQRGETFPQIFEQYESDKLPYYKPTKRTKIAYAKTMENWYRRFYSSKLK